MSAFISTAESLMSSVVELFVILMELFGVIILVLAAIKAFRDWMFKDPHVRLNLAQGIALALEFKLGGEVLRTVIVRTWQELGILGAIIVLRGALTFLIHWEIKNEKKELENIRDREAAL